MDFVQVTQKEFASIIKQPCYIYTSTDFNALNAYKCDCVHYLLFKDEHYRMGIIGGIKNNIFHSPFSAPFGGFSLLREDIRLTYIEDAIDSLTNWTRNHHFSGITITLPPCAHDQSQLSKYINCLYRKSFKVIKIDLSYYYNLEKFNDTYINQIWKEGRNNLRKSFVNQLTFNCCTNFNEKFIAFDIIRQNKEAHSYPLHLCFDQIIETSKIVDCDFFLVKDRHSEPIASAIVFHVSSEIVQVIYWGDLREYGNLKPMNFLSFKIFEYYKLIGKKMVDLGPSTCDSAPNYGLCAFKESIGCEITTKFSFTIRF